MTGRKTPKSLLCGHYLGTTQGSDDKNGGYIFVGNSTELLRIVVKVVGQHASPSEPSDLGLPPAPNQRLNDR